MKKIILTITGIIIAVASIAIWVMFNNNPEALQKINPKQAFFELPFPPKNTTHWVVRANCLDTVVGNFAVNADIIKCNTDGVLDYLLLKKPKNLRVDYAGLLNRTLVDQSVTIMSKTFDSKGTLIAEEAFPVIIKHDINIALSVIFTDVYASTQSYYKSNGNSYAGFCDRSINIGDTLNFKNELLGISNSFICKDSLDGWAMSAQMETNPSRYKCSDSKGVLISRTSPITTTSCE